MDEKIKSPFQPFEEIGKQSIESILKLAKEFTKDLPHTSNPALDQLIEKAAETSWMAGYMACGKVVMEAITGAIL